MSNANNKKAARKPARKEQSPLKRGVKSYAWSAATFGISDMGDTGHRVKNIAAAFRKKKRSYLVETFSEAVERQELTEQDIIKRMGLVKDTADLTAIFSAVSVILLIVATMRAWPFMAVSFLAMVTTWSVLQMMVWRFRYDQIRHRELFSFKDWILGRRTGEFK
jgi:Flp pilus assembly protein TadB